MHVYIVEEFYELNCVDCVFKCIILFKSVPVNRQIWYFVTKQVMFVSTHIICKILSILSAENKHFLFSVIYYGCAFIQSSLKYTLKIHFMGYSLPGYQTWVFATLYCMQPNLTQSFYLITFSSDRHLRFITSFVVTLWIQHQRRIHYSKISPAETDREWKIEVL